MGQYVCRGPAWVYLRPWPTRVQCLVLNVSLSEHSHGTVGASKPGQSVSHARGFRDGASCIHGLAVSSGTGNWCTHNSSSGVI